MREEIKFVQLSQHIRAWISGCRDFLNLHVQYFIINIRKPFYLRKVKLGTAYDSSSKDALIQSMVNLVNGIDCSNADTTVDIDFILPSSYTSESV